MATNNQYYLEQILAAMRELQSFLAEEFERARQNSDPKHDRNVLICGATQEDDCLCVVAKSLESEFYGNDEHVDAILDCEVEGFKEKTEDLSSPIHQVCAESIHDKVISASKNEFSSLSSTNNIVIGAIDAYKKEFPVASKMFDESPERDKYIPVLKPKPPDNYDTQVDTSMFGLSIICNEGVGFINDSNKAYKACQLNFEVYRSNMIFYHGPIKYGGDNFLYLDYVNELEIIHYNNQRGEGKVFSFDLLGSDGRELRVTCFNAVADQFYRQTEVGKVHSKQMVGPEVKRTSRRKTGAMKKKTKKHGEMQSTRKQIYSVFCLECQGTGINIHGEIVVRVIRIDHEMGIPCVAVYSTIDKDALHVKLAEESVCIGEAANSQSYLVVPNVLSATSSRGCKMLHPGYGFLPENAVFVEMCREHGINFIGPNLDSIREMGDKSTARDIMKNVGIRTVPGSDGLLQSTEKVVRLADEIGYPVMIKATISGGGREMLLANELEEFVNLLLVAKSEAAAAFGNVGIYLEKYIQNPRHIELQVLVDKYGNIIHFGEHDCSIQRRNQKLFIFDPGGGYLSGGLRIERVWAHWKKLGEPKSIVAPMVNDSELPFRLLRHKYGAEAAYTPILHLCNLIENENYCCLEFTTCKEDRPLFVQFCANDPDILLEAAQRVAPYCDYVDINLGCPQRIARRWENYGAFLMNYLPLVKFLVEYLKLYEQYPLLWRMIRAYVHRMLDEQNDGQQSSEIKDQLGWYILGQDQQHIGPCAFSELCEHFLNGYVSGSTLLWSEGRSDWQPSSAILDLITNIYQKASMPSNNDDKFGQWKEEVREAEAEAEVLKKGFNIHVGDLERPSMPSDGKEEFTYDDGTYKWDRGLRAWVPRDNDQTITSSDFDIEKMTFNQEDELFPTFNVDDNPVKEEVNIRSEVQKQCVVHMFM